MTEPDDRRDPESRLDEIAEHYDAFAGRVSVLMWLMVALVIAIAVVGTILLNQNSDRISDVHRVTAQIQQSRLDACGQNNERHATTVAALDAIEVLARKSQPIHLVALFRLAGVDVTPMARAALIRFERASIAAGQLQTLGLIDAIAPYRQCAQLAHGGTGITGGTGQTGRQPPTR